MGPHRILSDPDPPRGKAYSSSPKEPIRQKRPSGFVAPRSSLCQIGFACSVILLRTDTMPALRSAPPASSRTRAAAPGGYDLYSVSQPATKNALLFYSLPTIMVRFDGNPWASGRFVLKYGAFVVVLVWGTAFSLAQESAPSDRDPGPLLSNAVRCAGRRPSCGRPLRADILGAAATKLAPGAVAIPPCFQEVS